MVRLKKAVSLLVILMMVLCFFQPVSAEENNSVTVGIRVESMDSTLIPLTYVTMPQTHKTFQNYGLSGQTDPGFDTPVHVLAQYLTDSWGTTAADMGTMIGLAYSNLSQICGMYANGTEVNDGSHFWMYMVNDEYPALNGMGYSMTDCPLKNGDVITIYAMNYPGTAFYSYFQKQEYAVTQGEAVSLTLLGRNTMGGESLSISGATILSSEDGASATIETEIVTDNQGKATISFSEPGTYTLSSKKADITRAYAKVVVTQSDVEADKTLVAGDKVGLSIPTETSVNLTLPTVGESGKTIISWTSSDACVKPDGKITRGKDDKPVTLTATIEKGSAKETKLFPVIVKAYSDTEISEAIAAIKTALTAAAVKPVEGTDTNLIAMLQAQADQVALGSTITLTDVSSQPQVDVNGTITYGSAAKKNKDVAFMIDLLGKSDSGTVKVSVPAHVMTAQETVDDDALKLTWDEIKSSNTTPDSVKTRLILSTTGDSYATDITWSSSNTAVISNTGTVTRPAYQQPDAKVTLTATVKPSPYMEMYGHPGTADSKNVNIELTVSAFTQEEYDNAKKDVEAVKNYLQNIGKVKEMDTGESADLLNIDYDLGLIGNNTNETGVSDVDIAWSSTNASILVNTYRGKVLRPAVNEEAATGKLIATITKAGYSETLEFDTLVLPVIQAEIDAENEIIKKLSEKLSFDQIKKDNLNAKYVTTGLQMVYRGYCDDVGNTTYGTKNSGDTGIGITWETSNDTVMASYGTVKRPIAKDETVTMTATLSSILLKGVAGVNDVKVEIPITVVKPTPKLKNITVTSGNLTFDPDGYQYNLEILEETAEIGISFTKLDSTAVTEVVGATSNGNENYTAKPGDTVTIKSTLGNESIEYTLNFVKITKDQVAARSVVDQITALPAPDKLTLGNKSDVIAARNAYNILNDTQKALVNNLSTLEAAEKRIAVLETPAPIPIPIPDTGGTVKDEATGVEVVGLPTGTGIKVIAETDDSDKNEEAEKAAIAAGIKDVTIISLYSIKPDMSDADLAAFNSNPDSFVTLTIPLGADQQGYTDYRIYHKKTDGTVEWITPTLSADGKSLTFKVNAFSEFGVVGTKTVTETVNCTYQTQIENVGWQAVKSNGETSGTFGECKRLEGIKINIDAPGKDLGVTYQTHVQDIGWQGFKSNGSLSGTEGECKRLEAIQMKLSGNDADKFDIYYRVHAENYGWMGWAKNGASAGTEGLSLRLEAIEIKVVAKDATAPGTTEGSFVTGNIYCSYQTHVENIGWQDLKTDGAMSGTSGASLRLEGIKINVDNAGYDVGISYQTHVQDIGWQNLRTNGAMSGTEGESKRLEGIRISLTGADAELCDIYYQVHAENIGWMGWAKNGASAGTEGFGYRLEAIKIQVVPKGSPAPTAEVGTNDTAFLVSN
ncbi:immunoglobulin-like domain-containing protein [Acetobacterium bakii]|uniref:immunoglobulin-like domain-containing protein n=1 Tax=Acetobacterium bakii TaxID=52689 RepID=UPI000E0FA99E|nr:immunoglobulin-like domain-containing protein [Acetobacterium bakii]